MNSTGLKELLVKIYWGIRNIKFIVVMEYELRRIIGSRKFKLMLAVMLLPDIMFLLGLGGITPAETGVDICLEEFWRQAEDLILNFWTGLPAQLLAILIASELLAGEYENETFKLLVTKPVKKSGVVLGKWLAFLISMVLITLLPLLLLALLISLAYRGYWDALIAILSYDFWAGELTMMVGLTTIGTFTLLFSAFLSKSLYAALSSFAIILIYQLLVPSIAWLENPLQYTLSYQLGVILEELGFVLPEGRMYEGDIYITLPALYIVNLLFLTVAIVSVFFKEAK